MIRGWRARMEELPRYGSTHEAKCAPAGFIQIQLVLPIDHSSPMNRPWLGIAALLGNSPW
jgi:hypothetical protein